MGVVSSAHLNDCLDICMWWLDPLLRISIDTVLVKISGLNIDTSYLLHLLCVLFCLCTVGHETEHWSVYRRYLEFYVLESKLTEFHGWFSVSTPGSVLSELCLISALNKKKKKTCTSGAVKCWKHKREDIKCKGVWQTLQTESTCNGCQMAVRLRDWEVSELLYWVSSLVQWS